MASKSTFEDQSFELVTKAGEPSSVKSHAKFAEITSTPSTEPVIESTSPVSSASDSPEQTAYLTGARLIVTFSAMLVTFFLVLLDQTVTSTAIPRMASDFDALADVAWIASAYFVTEAGFIPLYGQVLVITPTKWVYIASISVFEVGSLICALAPNINVLIFGRALAGVGAGGVLVCVVAAIAEIAPLKHRPIMFGFFGIVMTAASVGGPLIGGAFSDNITWRWCFYLNLPLGLVSLLVIALMFQTRPPLGSRNSAIDGLTLKEKYLLRIDWLGCFLVLGVVVCLLLSLQWGGTAKPWNDPTVIGLLSTSGVLIAVFMGWQWFLGSVALVPLSIFRIPTLVGTTVEVFFVMLSTMLGVYYLPLQYQAKGHTATQSGIDVLPYLVSQVIASTIAAAVITLTGRYWLFLLLGPLISAVGAGLLFTFDAYTPNAKLIGYQILFGASLGVATQTPYMAMQAEFDNKKHLLSQASSTLLFFHHLGSAIGVCIGGTIFTNELTRQLLIYAPQLQPQTIEALKESVTVVPTLPSAFQLPVIQAYVKSLDYIYIVGVPAGVIAAVAAFLVKDYNVKAMGIKPGGDA